MEERVLLWRSESYYGGASLTMEERVLIRRSLKEFATLYICGHHIYKEIREAAVGEVLSCKMEARNAHHRCVVAVKVTGTTNIVGHLPRKVP